MKQTLLEIKKSKFIGLLYNVDNVLEVENILLQLKKEHKKANHICYAYKIVNGAEIVKFSDDKEPSGTAGKPILSVIEKKKMSNVLICVIRYFGGIKLGAGGLVRAYTKCASSLFLEE